MGRRHKYKIQKLQNFLKQHRIKSSWPWAGHQHFRYNTRSMIYKSESASWTSLKLKMLGGRDVPPWLNESTCSCWPRFSPQHLHGGSRSPVTPVPGDLTPSVDFNRQQAHGTHPWLMKQSYTCRQINTFYKIKVVCDLELYVRWVEAELRREAGKKWDLRRLPNRMLKGRTPY